MLKLRGVDLQLFSERQLMVPGGIACACDAKHGYASVYRKRWDSMHEEVKGRECILKDPAAGTSTN